MSLFRWITAGVLTAAVIVAVAIAVWPASNTDKARADGEAFGQAVVALDNAQSPADVDAALDDLGEATASTRDHAGDAVADQVDRQDDALSRAADGWTGVHSTDDSFSETLYQSELDAAVDDVNDNAADFRTEGPEVQQAFWDGFQTAVQ
jgi:predicted transcriptional regulator